MRPIQIIGDDVNGYSFQIWPYHNAEKKIAVEKLGLPVDADIAAISGRDPFDLRNLAVSVADEAWRSNALYRRSVAAWCRPIAPVSTIRTPASLQSRMAQANRQAS